MYSDIFQNTKNVKFNPISVKTQAEQNCIKQKSMNAKETKE